MQIPIRFILFLISPHLPPSEFGDVHTFTLIRNQTTLDQLLRFKKSSCISLVDRLVLAYSAEFGPLFQLKPATPYRSKATPMMIDLLHKNQFQSTLSLFLI